jgi:putative nucleotidyltransferase with HDIG domain
MSGIALRVPEILDRVRTVKALSTTAQRLLTLVGEASADLRPVVTAIENDPALTVSVLRAVNSATMSLRREVTTVREAIIFLGEAKIIGIALAASAGQMFNTGLAGYRGTRGDLGRHCLWTAVAARELARHTNGLVNTNVAFTAGLLHDIGKAVISDFLAESLADGDALPHDITDGSQLALERTLLGTDHSAVGRALADRWQVPPTLVAAIEFHHEPDVAPDAHRPIAFVVHLADMLAMMFGVGTGTDDLQYTLHPSYATYVGIEPQALEALALDVHLDFMTTAEALLAGDPEEKR